QADESDAIYRSDFDTDMATDLDHSAEESENQMSSYQNGSNPLAITPLQFAITDPTIAQDETDHPSAQTKTEIEPLDLTFGDFEEEQNIDEEDEEELVEVITPAFETQNEASPVAESNKARYIGHEIDPKSGMPIPVKAPKEFPMAGRLPGLDLLGNPPPVTESYDEAELAELASLIEEQFKHFNIEVSVVNIEPGPVITRFELDLAPGV
ncbi:DNA translocase FtsK, partial [Tsukamurella asaccharolytica]